MRFASRLLSLLLLFVSSIASADETPSRWSIEPDGSITWDVKPGAPHSDNIEMSGQRVSVIVTYGVDENARPSVKRQVIWPMLRFQPNLTRNHLDLTFSDDAQPRVLINRQTRSDTELLTRVNLKGIVHLEGTLGKDKGIAVSRTIFPSTTQPVVFDRTIFTNRTSKDVVVEVEDNQRTVQTKPERGVYGSYLATATVLGIQERTLKPGESTDFTVVLSARRVDEPPPTLDVATEEKTRRDRVASFLDRLQLETPDPILNTEFAFAKIRVGESIYQTRGGPMHGPGGGAYYAAMWCNDTAEYASPFFGYFGDALCAESALNCYRLFGRYMNPEYNPIPSSIISEGAGTWHGAKDRGDMAMLAYGASRFALAYSRRDTAEELWPLIEWCLEYCRRKVTPDGVLASDSDELENRFPAGKANIYTSCLYYDALLSASMLGAELRKPAAQLAAYAEQAKTLRAAIENYFGAEIEGYHAYRYYDGNTVLRAWSCGPLTVGILDRKEGAIAALFSPRLWTTDGLATQAGERTFWDRSTLSALRGVFIAGATDQGLDHLAYYSKRRLLGEHVPYPVEAYPEGNQRHLSAEGALYARIYTEGMLGLRPTGLRSFTLTPHVPKSWPRVALKRVDGFGAVFDISITRAGDKLEVQVLRDGASPWSQTIADGETVKVDFGS